MHSFLLDLRNCLCPQIFFEMLFRGLPFKFRFKSVFKRFEECTPLMSLEEKRDPDLELELSRAKNLRWGSLPIHNNLTIYHNRKASKISQDESFSSFLLESYASEVWDFGGIDMLGEQDEGTPFFARSGNGHINFGANSLTLASVFKRKAAVKYRKLKYSMLSIPSFLRVKGNTTRQRVSHGRIGQQKII